MMCLVALYLQARIRENVGGLTFKYGGAMLGGGLTFNANDSTVTTIQICMLYYAHSLKFGLLPGLSNFI